MSKTINATIDANACDNSVNNSTAKAGKQKLTTEQRAILEIMIAGAFSSKAIHVFGDNLAKGLHKAADGVQYATDKTAFGAGVAQLTTVPVAMTAWAKLTSRFAKKQAEPTI